MNLSLAGYRLYWVERKKHRQTREAYANLVTAHFKAQAELSTPCPECQRYQDERDDALLVAESVTATLFWLEQDMGVKS